MSQSQQEQWSAVDGYLTNMLVKPDAVLDETLRTSADAGLPAINVTPNQGKLLHVLALSLGARRILEVGTLGGYSAIWLARALARDGRLVTLEYDARHAQVARANIARAGLSDRVELRLGRALESLEQIASQGADPFDLVFIDADKANTAEYFDRAVRLSRPGAVIVVDNVVRKGEVVNAASGDQNVQGIRRFLDALAADRRVVASAIQTVGSKGYDGFVLAAVK